MFDSRILRKTTKIVSFWICFLGLERSTHSILVCIPAHLDLSLYTAELVAVI